MMKKLPEKGTAKDVVLAELAAMKKEDVDWKSARIFSLIYNAGEELRELGREAFGMFITENGLGPTVFPSLRRLETEVIAMTAALMGGDDNTVGSMTSGGTESIFMAVKTARDWALAKKKEATEPQIVIPVTAHPAFDKAAHYLGLKITHVPVGPDFRADVEAMKSAATKNTILMCGSAMSYPHGMIDDIPPLAAFAAENNIWFHVDSCLGGMVLPFARNLGYPIPICDFRVPGVTSMSADIHKYGLTPKGASTVLYRNASYRQYQYFAYADWPGGVYATSAMAGARTGGPIAAAWAVMNFLGEEGYMKIISDTMTATKKLIEGVRAVPGLKVLGEPDATVFAIASDTLNVYALSDAMTRHNWHLEKQHLPPCLHVTVSPAHLAVVDEFLADLAIAAGEIKDIDSSKISQEAAMYGMMASMPDRSLARDLAVQFMNDLYRLK